MHFKMSSAIFSIWTRLTFCRLVMGYAIFTCVLKQNLESPVWLPVQKKMEKEEMLITRSCSFSDNVFCPFTQKEISISEQSLYCAKTGGS